MSRGRALILQHHPLAPPGNFGEWALARGYRLEVLMSDDHWEVPDLSSYDFVGSLGSVEHSYDDELDWLPRELDFLAAAHRTQTPVCGICFGSQSLARSLGAETRLAPAVEVGWYEIDRSTSAAVPSGPWFFWHEDQFDVPDGAELMATTPRGPALFRTDKDWGIQFHPELSPEALEHWIRHSGNGLDEKTLAGMRHNIETEAEAARERAWRLYDAFLDDVRAAEPQGARPAVPDPGLVSSPNPQQDIEKGSGQ
jgi:GMP synthase-like glutamine amidotransferase